MQQNPELNRAQTVRALNRKKIKRKTGLYCSRYPSWGLKPGFKAPSSSLTLLLSLFAVNSPVPPVRSELHRETRGVEQII